MVLPLIITVGLIAVVILFKDQIKGFADDLRSKANNPEEQAKQKIIDEKGAFGNTEEFLFGKKFIEEREANQVKFNESITALQNQIDTSIKGVNTNLVQAQANLEQFAKNSQQAVATSVSDISKNIDTGIKGVNENFDQFKKDSIQNIDTIGQQANSFFTNLFNNPFGGQSGSKSITTQTPLPNSPTPKVTMTPKGSSNIDLSFLTPNTSLSSVRPEEEKIVVSQAQGRSTRFS